MYFSYPVKVLRVSESCACLGSIPVSPKCFCFLHTRCEENPSISGPSGAPRRRQKSQNSRFFFDFYHVPPKWSNGPQIFSIVSRKHFSCPRNSFFSAGQTCSNLIPFVKCLWAGFQNLQRTPKTAPGAHSAPPTGTPKTSKISIFSTSTMCHQSGPTDPNILHCI